MRVSAPAPGAHTLAEILIVLALIDTWLLHRRQLWRCPMPARRDFDRAGRAAAYVR
jgi:hypothetical protein